MGHSQAAFKADDHRCRVNGLVVCRNLEQGTKILQLLGGNAADIPQLKPLPLVIGNDGGHPVNVEDAGLFKICQRGEALALKINNLVVHNVYRLFMNVRWGLLKSNAGRQGQFFARISFVSLEMSSAALSCMFWSMISPVTSFQPA